MTRWLLATVLLAPMSASADHEGHEEHADIQEDHSGHVLLGGMHDHKGTAVSVGLLAASYESPLYEGSYQAAVVGGRFARGRFGVSASFAVYRLERNGSAELGIGDVMTHVHATALRRGSFAAGAMLMASLPTGPDREGFGMGHVMLMPEAWATYTPGSIAIAMNAGYAYMFGGASAHAEHGAAMWPLVDPMYASEVTFGGTAMVPVARALGVGARLAGGLAVGNSLDAVEEAGMTADAWRVAAGGRAVWIAGDWITTFEVLGGVTGEPFQLRGLLETARRF